MKTKYDVTNEVGIKGIVVSIHASTSGIKYRVRIKKRIIEFEEDELSEVLDLSDVEKIP